MKKIFAVLLCFILCSCSVNDNTKDIKKKTKMEIGSAYTQIKDREANRFSNILLAADKISGFKLLPNEEFSFNKVVGERTIENGFKEAKIIKDKECARGIGGGICQVSSTLYMAVKNANLKVNQRHKHSEPVSYAPNGDDATVVYGLKDFSFVNNTTDTIYITVYVENNILYAKLSKNILT